MSVVTGEARPPSECGHRRGTAPARSSPERAWPPTTRGPRQGAAPSRCGHGGPGQVRPWWLLNNVDLAMAAPSGGISFRLRRTAASRHGSGLVARGSHKPVWPAGAHFSLISIVVAGDLESHIPHPCYSNFTTVAIVPYSCSERNSAQMGGSPPTSLLNVTNYWP